MFHKIILLSCIILYIAAEVPKLRKIKDCRAIGGRCTSAANCPEQGVLRTTCTIGTTDSTGVCCAVRKKAPRLRGEGVKKRKPKGGCRQRHSCRKLGGRCISTKEACQGQVEEGACKNKKVSCQCCIYKSGDGTETKFRNGRQRKYPNNKRKKKDKGCKKKKKCKGFCVAENEECLGDLDPKGCKGKKCSCCTLGEHNGEKEADPSAGTNNVDYGSYYYGGYEYYPDYYYSGDYYYYQEKCFGKNINGSCEADGCFICGDGQCYPANFKCDYMDDCEDASDEEGCPRLAPGSCPREYKWVLSSCYKFLASPSSWSISRMVCRALNGDLALVYDNQLFSAYMQAFHATEQAVYWLGIHRVNGTYTWVNGTHLPDNSSLWGTMKNPGNDGEDCVVMDVTENRLQPISCEVVTYNNKSIHSICEYSDDDYYY